ncbi:MAG TPA: DUF1302 domain-containing protein [Solimonas sp.]
MNDNAWRYARGWLAVGLSLAGAPAVALDFRWGEVSGQLDTFVTVGAVQRIQSRDPGLVSQGNGGTGLSSNIDDGNLNYDRGDWVSAIAFINQDLQLRWDDSAGVFVRGLYFYDAVNSGFDEPARRGAPRPHEVERLIGRGAELLDAYVYANFELADRPFSLRIGRQVLSWGESTFIQFGVNQANTYDLTKLRFAGADLRNVFTPVPMISVQTELTDDTALSGFYLLDAREISIDPQGSYYSPLDGLVEGGDFLAVESRFFDQNELPDGYKIFRKPDVRASRDGQYGFALSRFLPQLGGLELGLYFLNVHSMLPVTSGYSMSEAQFAQLNELVPGVQDPTGLSGVLIIRGLLNPESLTPGQIETLRAAHLGVGGYQLEYPEDLKIYGLTFNTTLPFGVALQGEFSYTQDQVFQIDDYELVYHGLSPVTQLAGPIGGTAFALFFPPNQLGQNQTPGEYFQGYRRYDMLQLQFTGTYLFGPRNPFGAQQWLLLVEAGATYIPDLPGKSELRFEGPGTFEKGGTDGVSDRYYSENFGWGYRVLTQLNYPNLFGSGWGFNPQLTFFHDVEGTAAGPARSFVQDSMQSALALRFDYAGAWTLELGWVSYFGIGKDYRNTNLLHDRDLVSATVKYSF